MAAPLPEVERREASDPRTPLERLVELAEHYPAEALANPAWTLPGAEEYRKRISALAVLEAVETWAEVPYFWLLNLVTFPHAPVRLALAKKPLPADALVRLVQDPDPQVRAVAWAHPLAQKEPVRSLILLFRAMERGDSEALPKALQYTSRGPYLEILLARHPGTPEDVLLRLAKARNPFVLEGFAQRDRLSSAVLEALWPKLEGQPQWAEALLQKEIPPEYRARLYTLAPHLATPEVLSHLPEEALSPWLDGPVRLRLLLTQHPELSADLLARLAEDPEAVVRAEVASRPDLPGELRQKLLDDPAPVVRQRARRTHEPS